MSHYTHFITEELELSRVINALKRSNSSVSREFARNILEDGTYSANCANKKYAKRRKTADVNLYLKMNRQKITLLKSLNRDGLPNRLRNVQSWKTAVQFVIPNYLQGYRQRYIP